MRQTERLIDKVSHTVGDRKARRKEWERVEETQSEKKESRSHIPERLTESCEGISVSRCILICITTTPDTHECRPEEELAEASSSYLRHQTA